MENALRAPVQSLHGVGPALKARLEHLGIHRVEDILFHLPLRYQDRTRLTPIAAARPGQDVVIEGNVRLADVVYGRRRSLVVRVEDDSGLITLRFFHFNAGQKNNLEPGVRIRCFGEVRNGASGLEMYHPEYQRLGADELVPVEQNLTPIYPSTDGISQRIWQKLSLQALTMMSSGVTELLTNEYSDLADSLAYLHNPPPDAPQELIRAGRHPAQLALAFEELVAHNLALLATRQTLQRAGAPPFREGQSALQKLIHGLPFLLTSAQHRVVTEISADLRAELPMLRLVQGDVGSGKTVVAACAAIQATASGYQVAIMAPTDILAQQHLASFTEWLAPLDIRCGFLSGKLSAGDRRSVLEDIASGQVQVAVGTHALFQDAVDFDRLGLVIVDEQHRFGVHQRLALTHKVDPDYGRPHQLIMTATPIPRTLSMVAYADLDCSVIDELPPGRQSISTALIDSDRRPQVLARVGEACAAGRQVYWVCTLIEESEQLQAQAAEVTAREMTAALPGVSVGLIHGRMHGRDKDAVMARFNAGDIQLLVATTVIEVGVDVPNASLMIIENPERLGLAQLHQLRGRVGRGTEASYCLLLYQKPLSRASRERLSIMRESSDGFYIAERDLALRGPGEVLGTRQTGLLEFRVAKLEVHGDLVPAVQEKALAINRGQPAVASALIARWLGSASDYGAV